MQHRIHDQRFGTAAGIRIALAALLTLPLTAQSVFPTGTTIWQTGLTQDGFTFFPAGSRELVLIDMGGNVVNTWMSPLPGEEFGETAEPLANGNVLGLSKLIIAGGWAERTAVELDWNGNTVWTYPLPAAYLSLHHDFERLANGNTLFLCNRLVDVPQISPIQLIDDLILEVDPLGNIVWEWNTYEHFNEFGFDGKARTLISQQGGDWAHTNTVSVVPPNSTGNPAFTPGNLIVSQRHTNIVFVIERTTGAVVWQIGPSNPITYGQHQAHMIPSPLPGAGKLLIYDNGSGTGYPLLMRARAYSRLVEVDVNTKGVTWFYDARTSGERRRMFFSDIAGGLQRLPNGNTLTLDSVRGRIFEVDAGGTIVWEYVTDQIGTVLGGVNDRLAYRAYRLPYSWSP